MRNDPKSMWVLRMVMAFLAASLCLPGGMGAGDLEPPAGPPVSTMHTLDEIYAVVTVGCPPCPPCPPCLPYSIEAAVPKTWQTVSYLTGDDGDLQMGVEWPIPRFTDNADGTVIDDLSGLIWMKDANCDGEKTWEEALSFCNGLRHGDCGLSDGSNTGDWRLPNIRELQSLTDYGNYYPALPTGHLFSNVQLLSSYYWTSTTSASSDNAWIVMMDDGNLTGNLKSYDNWVWCVRDR